MELLANIGGIVTGLLVLVGLFKPIFGDLDDFYDCVKFWVTPDIISFFRGEGVDDYWAEMKLFLWLLLGIGSGYGTSILINKITGA